MLSVPMSFKIHTLWYMYRVEDCTLPPCGLNHAIEPIGNLQVTKFANPS
jgi:hypothetical protein